MTGENRPDSGSTSDSPPHNTARATPDVRRQRPLAYRADGTLDTRRHAIRADLAAADLRGVHPAQRYTTGDWAQVVQPIAPLRRAPRTDASLETEMLFGEVVVVHDVRDGWAWVQILRDDYVGYVATAALTTTVNWPTHKVRALGTFVYPETDIKSPPLAHLSLNSRLTVAGTVDSFAALAGGGYVVARHVADEATHARDFAEVAERFIGTPYLWGGRSRIGIDCSGLVQMALEAAGRPCPRDSDMQEAELGEALDVAPDLEGLARGDLVFWPGHVGIMCDGLMLLHANAHHMAVTVETLPEAVERIARASGQRPSSVKRLGP
ncbi:MAG: NlpC/P60 family protein [Hyphomicrobiaceae bacterium]|nr:NlpC/P60 family protein [Hyphomicrobiaceae bacterium]